MTDIITLKEFYENNEEFGKTISFLNVDDIFRDLIKKGFWEVKVDRIEMLYIIGFLIGNYLATSEMAITGKVDKFLGVNLIEI